MRERKGERRERRREGNRKTDNIRETDRLNDIIIYLRERE